jgi:hypothetical protein
MRSCRIYDLTGTISGSTPYTMMYGIGATTSSRVPSFCPIRPRLGSASASARVVAFPDGWLNLRRMALTEVVTNPLQVVSRGG